MATAVPGIGRLSIETSTRSILDRHSVDWAAYQLSQDTFGGDEFLTVLIDGKHEFGLEALKRVQELSDRFESVAGVRRVDSLTTVPAVSVDSSGDIDLEPALVRSGEIEPALVLERLRQDRIAPGAIVGEGGRFLAINLVLDSDSDVVYQSVLPSLGRILQPGEAVSGVPIFRSEADRRMREELTLFIPLTVFLVGACLFILYGSLRAVVIPLAISGSATWVTLGVMGASGVPLTITTVILPSILLALGCAYVVHLLSACAGCERDQAGAQIAPIALPILLSSVTTAIGFLTMAAVRIDAVVQLGTFGAFGVLLLGVAALTAGPAGIVILGVPPKRALFSRRLMTSSSRLLLSSVTGRRSGLWLISGFATATILALAGATQIRVETDVIRWFPKEDPIRRDYDQIRDAMSGISPMNVVIQASAGGDVSEPVVMAAIDGLSRHLGSLASVGKSISVSDPLRQLNGGLLGDESQPLPDRQAQISQLLLLLESDEYIGELISDDRMFANVLLRVNNNGSKDLLEVAREARVWWGDHGVNGFTATPTGIMYEFARAQEAIANGQLVALGIALGAVALVLLVVFRRFALAITALIPNIVPVSVLFGLMGWLGIPIDASTVVIGGLVLGIAVDDTVHVVSGYRDRLEAGVSPVNAVRETLERVAHPLICSSVAVSAGFLILTTSDFLPVVGLGGLTSGVMLLCLAADLALLPALLVAASRRGIPL